MEKTTYLKDVRDVFLFDGGFFAFPPSYKTATAIFPNHRPTVSTTGTCTQPFFPGGSIAVVCRGNCGCRSGRGHCPPPPVMHATQGIEEQQSVACLVLPRVSRKRKLMFCGLIYDSSTAGGSPTGEQPAILFLIVLTFDLWIKIDRKHS